MSTLATTILCITVAAAAVLSLLSRRVVTRPSPDDDRGVLWTAVRLDSAALGVFVVGSLAAGLTASL